ncbi:MAG: C-type lectin domain-containing protein [Verrucomicrobia bacterium]|nr:C-type lectin domain-containing protein [Verrucomicrobiota bacterium]
MKTYPIPSRKPAVGLPGCVAFGFAVGIAGGQLHAGLIASGQYNGHTYQVWGNDGLTNDERDYLSASAFAATLNFAGAPGRLVRMDDFLENSFVHALLGSVDALLTSTAADGGGVRYVWIGADDLDDADTINEGVWRWLNGGDQFWQGGPAGTPVGGLYNNWAFGRFGQSEPDDFNGNQDAAAMALDAYPALLPGLLGQPGQWNDINHLNVLPFVVEFAAIPEPRHGALVIAGLALSGALWRRLRR